jgi:hypothetical protein
VKLHRDWAPHELPQIPLRRPDKNYFEMPSGGQWVDEAEVYLVVEFSRRLFSFNSDTLSEYELYITRREDSDVMYVCSNDNTFAVELSATPDAIIRALGFLRLHSEN